MAARRRSHKTRDLPPNLYVRNDGYYSFRDPRTGKEYGLGRDKRYAINEAVAANMALLPEKTISLADRIKGKNTVLFDEAVTAFKAELSERKLSPETSARHANRLKMIEAHFSGTPLEKMDIKTVFGFLNIKASEGKTAIANQLRALLSDIFKSAISRGITDKNPAAATRAFRHDISRSRLTYDEYLIIRKQADQMDRWFQLCLDLAVVTGQREGDLSRIKWTDISEGKLHIVQSKTRTPLRISLDTGIRKINLTLESVLAQLRAITGGHDFVLGGRTAKKISDCFREARKRTGLTWENDPPPFHELRSIAGRLYAEERGIEFARKLLAHKSISMTEKYRDGRGREWLDI